MTWPAPRVKTKGSPLFFFSSFGFLKASESVRKRERRATQKGKTFPCSLLLPLFSSLSFLFSSLSPVERRVELGAVGQRARVVDRDLVSGLGLERAGLGAGLEKRFVLCFFLLRRSRLSKKSKRCERMKKEGGKKKPRSAPLLSRFPRPLLSRAFLSLISIETLIMLDFRTPI